MTGPRHAPADWEPQWDVRTMCRPTVPREHRPGSRRGRWERDREAVEHRAGRWVVAFRSPSRWGLAAPGGVASAVDPASAEPLATEEQAVPGGTGAGNQTDPHLSGSLLAFTVDRGHRVGDPVRRPGRRDPTGTIPNGGNRDSLSDVSGDLIVFRRVYTDGTSQPADHGLRRHRTRAGCPRGGAAEPGARRAFAVDRRDTVAFMQFVGASSTQTEVCVADVADLTAPGACA